MTTLEELEVRVKALENAAIERGKYVAGCEHNLRETALRYARLVTSRIIVQPNGVRNVLSQKEADEQANYEVSIMKKTALSMLFELGIAGEQP